MIFESVGRLVRLIYNNTESARIVIRVKSSSLGVRRKCYKIRVTFFQTTTTDSPLTMRNIYELSAIVINSGYKILVNTWNSSKSADRGEFENTRRYGYVEYAEVYEILYTRE